MGDLLSVRGRGAGDRSGACVCGQIQTAGRERERRGRCAGHNPGIAWIIPVR